MKRMSYLFMFLFHSLFASSTWCMDAPRDCNPLEEQENFNHLIRSHQFDAARECVRENFLIRKSYYICPLFLAIEENDYTAASFLLKSLKMSYYEGHYAQVSTKKMAKLLMNQGITHEDKNDLQLRLFRAIVERRLRAQTLITWVVKQIENINMDLNKQKCTLLQYAVSRRAENVVKALLEHPDIEVDKPDTEGFTAFDYAIKTGDVHVISLFNKIGMFFWPIQRANPFKFRSSDDPVIVRCNRDFLARLFCAAQQQEKKMPDGENTKKGTYNSRQGITCNSVGYYFLHPSLQDLESWAGKKMVDAAQEQLLVCCINVLQDMKNPSSHIFKNAIRCDYGFIMTDHNKAIQSVINSPFVLFYDTKGAFKILLAALKAPNNEAFKYIIRNLQPDLSRADEDGNTLLHHAVMLDEHWIAGFLIENGIDFFVRNKKRKTALDDAQLNHPKCVVTMIQAFAQECTDSAEYARKNIKKYIQEGYLLRELKFMPMSGEYEPLLHAAAHNNPDLCRMLLKAGASVGVKNSLGYTTLQWIIDLLHDGYLCNDTQSIKILLEYGAEVTEGMMQRMIKHKDIHALLLNAWKKQEEERMTPQCCICFEVNVQLSGIKCTNKHSELMCNECSGQIKECPLCRQPLQ